IDRLGLPDFDSGVASITVEISDDGRFVGTSSDSGGEGGIALYDRTTDTPYAIARVGFGGTLGGAVLSGDGRFSACGEAEVGFGPLLFDRETARYVFLPFTGIAPGYQSYGAALALSRTGRYVLYDLDDSGAFGFGGALVVVDRDGDGNGTFDEP